jgi:WD40 repeat protein
MVMAEARGSPMTDAAVEPAPSAPERPDVFISYSRRDADFAKETLAPDLQARGLDVWIDVDDIRGGASDWWAVVTKGIEASKAVLFVLTPNLLESSICRDELDHARALNKRIIPIQRDSVDDLPIPVGLREPNWISARPEDDFDAALDATVEAVQTDEDWIEQHARLTQRTVEWLSADRHSSYLLRGRDLRAAERWLEERDAHTESPTADQVAYISAGRRASARRVGALLLGVVLALGVSIALGVVAYIQRQTARSQAFAARAIDASQRDPEQGLRLALDAADLGDSALVKRALREAIAAAGWTHILRDEPARPLNDVALSPDGRLAAIGGRGDSASVWEVGSGRHVASLRHRGVIHSLQFAPDGRRIATAAGDGTARLWNVDGRELRVLRPGTPEVWSAAFDRSGRRIVTSTDRGSAQVWELDSRAAPVRLPGGAQDHLAFVPFSPDGQQILTAGPRGTLRVWTPSPRPRAMVLRRAGGAGDLATVATFDDDGRRVLAGYDTGTACVWTLRRGGTPDFCRQQPAGGTPPATITDAEFSRDGTLLVTASADGTAVVRRAGDGRLTATLQHAAPVNSASFSPGSNRIVTAGVDRRARIWTSDGRLERELGGHTDAVVVARFSGDGTTVLTGSDDGSARVWMARQGVTTMPGRPLRGADVAFSPDSRRLLAVDPDGNAAVWDWRRGTRVDLEPVMVTSELGFPPCARYTGCAPWSPDSTSIVGANSRDEVTIWSARTGAGRALGLRGASGAAFTPDGRRLVVLGRERGAQVVDRVSGKQVGEVGSGSAIVQSVHFTANGSRMLTATVRGRVRLWNDELGRVPLPAPGASSGAGPEAAAIAPDGRRLAVGANSGSLRVYELPGGQARTATQHLGTVSQVAFDRTGARIVTVGGDRTARVWEAAEPGASVAVLRGHDDVLQSAEFSPDGRFVLTSSLDGTARLWDPALETAVLEFRKGAFGGARFGPDGRSIALGGGNTVELHRCEVCASFEDLVDFARARLPSD